MARRAGNNRLWILIAATILLLVSCGGSGGGTETGALDGPSDTDGSGSSDSGDDSEDDDSADVVESAQDALEDMVDTEGGSATVTIGQDTWELGVYPDIPMAVCDADFFGGFLAVVTSEGDLTGPLNAMNLTLPGGAFEDPPSVTMNVAVGGEAEWIADETIYEQSPELPAGIGVTEFSIDGPTASGTAMFYEQESYYQFTAGLVDELEMAEGTFQVTCGG